MKWAKYVSSAGDDDDDDDDGDDGDENEEEDDEQSGMQLPVDEDDERNDRADNDRQAAIISLKTIMRWWQEECSAQWDEGWWCTREQFSLRLWQ